MIRGCVESLSWEVSASLGPELGIGCYLWTPENPMEESSALWCTVRTGPVQTVPKEADIHPHNRVVCKLSSLAFMSKFTHPESSQCFIRAPCSISWGCYRRWPSKNRGASILSALCGGPNDVQAYRKRKFCMFMRHASLVVTLKGYFLCISTMSGWKTTTLWNSVHLLHQL